MRSAPSTLIFVHIPKTAGTTLHQVVAKQYDPKRVLYLYGLSVEEAICRLRDLNKSESANVRFITGHKPLGLHRWLDFPVAYMTMLRDPIERTISYYHYIRGNPEHFAHRDARHLSLEEFVQSGVVGTIVNGQTQYLSSVDGTYPDVSTMSCADLLAKAKNNIREYNVTIGLVERFDESLILFRYLFDWHMPLYVRMNVNKNRPKRESLPTGVLDTLKELNVADLRLYEYGVTLLKKSITTLPQVYSRELRIFRLLNRFYSSYKGLCYKARTVSQRIGVG